MQNINLTNAENKNEESGEVSYLITKIKPATVRLTKLAWGFGTKNWLLILAVIFSYQAMVNAANASRYARHAEDNSADASFYASEAAENAENAADYAQQAADDASQIRRWSY